MVFFEAPHRVLATLDAMVAAFGPERAAAAVRELTKVHEQVLRGPLGQVRAELADQGPRGELTLVVAGTPAGGAASASPAELAAEVGRLVEGGTSTRDAVTAVAEATGTPRRSVYQAVLEARGEPG
jgi:16S rRNA (cytidine1402-2'-O)-methyltransferase